MPRETLLARTLVELADTLVADFDVVELLTLLADGCVDVLDVGAAGLMLAAPDGNLRVMASSSEAMRVLELFEIQAQTGPVRRTAIRTGSRWSTRTWSPRRPVASASRPRRSPRAFTPSMLCRCGCGARSSARSTCSTSSRVRCARPTWTRPRPSPTWPPSRSSNTAPATEAHALNEQLNGALNTRIVIEQAKGVVAERQGLDMEQAFATLRNHARNHNRRLADVATDVIGGSPHTARARRAPATRL